MSIERAECEDYCPILTLVGGELDRRIEEQEERLNTAQAHERALRLQHHESDGAYQDLTDLDDVDFEVRMQTARINSVRGEMAQLRETCEGIAQCAVAQLCARIAVSSQLDAPKNHN